MTNGYMVYLLRILAAQGALASVYTDPDDPEGFSAGRGGGRAACAHVRFKPMGAD